MNQGTRIERAKARVGGNKWTLSERVTEARQKNASEKILLNFHETAVGNEVGSVENNSRCRIGEQLPPRY